MAAAVAALPVDTGYDLSERSTLCRAAVAAIPVDTGRLTPLNCFSMMADNSVAAIPVDTERLTLVDSSVCPNLYQWKDVCNVYVLMEGRSALLFDLGDGSIVPYLQQAGVQIEWTLFTHHHREQCQGYPLLKNADTKIAVPETERQLFENPNRFLKMQASLGDPFTTHGASYIRPPIEPVRVDKTFSRMDFFTWRGIEIRCVDTRGNSPGGMSYFINTGKGWIAITGDVMMAGGRMHTWFDTEWDYGFAAGLYALHNAAAFVEDFRPVLMLPSHGDVIKDAVRSLPVYREKLKNLADLTLRGYDMNYSPSFQNNSSTPTRVPDVWQVTPHVFVFKGPNFSPNFALLLADNGKALAIDCGLFDRQFLESRLDLMQERLGLKTIDAVIITHIHGDHALQVPVLAEKYGTRVWVTADMADKLEFPEKFNYAAMLDAYSKDLTSLKADRILRHGERMKWEGYDLTVDWMPGQTRFALCVHGMIDGKKIAFTGDNIFGDPTDSRQNGHEALFARTAATLEDGYILGAEFLKNLDPDIIVGGHSYVMNNPRQMIRRYHQWAYEMRDALREMSFLDDYRYWFDPYWVQFESFRQTMQIGSTSKSNIIIRNFGKKKQEYHIRIHTPQGVRIHPQIIHTFVEAESELSIPVEYTVTEAASTGIQRQTLDVTLGDIRLGEWFDGILNIEK